MNKMIAMSVLAAAFAGCVGPSIPPVTDCDDSERFSSRDYTYPNVRIGKLFGINQEVLADTNIFPVVGNNWHHYNLNLAKDENGFVRCTAHLEQDAKTGRLKLEYISLERTLKPGADDKELLHACRSAISWVNDKLGTDMELDALVDLNRLRIHNKCVQNRCALALCHTSVYANLADGQQVHVSGHDAVYMKRGNEYVEMSPPGVEVTFRVGDDDCARRLKCRRHLKSKDGKIVLEAEPTAKDVQTVSVGADISEKLSAAMKKRDCERPRRANPAAADKKTDTVKVSES